MTHLPPLPQANNLKSSEHKTLQDSSLSLVDTGSQKGSISLADTESRSGSSSTSLVKQMLQTTSNETEPSVHRQAKQYTAIPTSQVFSRTDHSKPVHKTDHSLVVNQTGADQGYADVMKRRRDLVSHACHVM